MRDRSDSRGIYRQSKSQMRNRNPVKEPKTVIKSLHFMKRKEATTVEVEGSNIDPNLMSPIAHSALDKLATPDQNMKKHINSPNLMIPNKIGKPLSWYNELELLAAGGAT